MATAFVTGGTGFLGINLVHALIAQGDRVVAIHRATSDTRRLAKAGAELLACSLDDVDALARAMPEGVDVVYHMAGDLSWWSRHAERQRRTNVAGTRHVVEAALRRDAKRFVHTSSIVAYGMPNQIIREDTPSNADRFNLGYLRTKWQGEREVRDGIARGLPAVIMNPANILGPYDTTGWARLVLLVDKGKLPGAPSGRSSFCHATEVVRAHLAAAARGRVGENYLLGGADASFVELGAAIARHLGRKPPRVVPAAILRAFGAVNDFVSLFTGKEADITRQNARVFCRDLLCDSSKATRELDYRPRTLDEMVGDCVSWLRSEGLLRA
jgi:nucleoside-diphosphate-sugar epimerase